MQKDDKGKGKVTVDEIRDQMKNTWVKKCPSITGNEPAPKPTSSNSSEN